MDSKSGGLARRAALLALLGMVCMAASAYAQAAEAPAPAKLALSDEAGRRVDIPWPVHRIVSLAPSVTETLYALGAQARLVGVTDYCDFPPEAKSKTRVGGAVNPNLEAVAALKPDLVVATKSLNRKVTVDALEQLGIAVYVTDARTVADVVESTGRLAHAIGADAQGEAEVATLRVRLEALKQRINGAPLKRVLFVVWADPLISVGRETFLADALRLAGAESVVETSQEWPRLNLEEVVRLQPEYLIFSSSHSETVGTPLDDLRTRPGWRGLEAIRKGRVIVISDAINRPAPRLIGALEELARQLHPEAFNQNNESRKSKLEIRPASASRSEFWVLNFEFRAVRR